MLLIEALYAYCSMRLKGQGLPSVSCGLRLGALYAVQRHSSVRSSLPMPFRSLLLLTVLAVLLLPFAGQAQGLPGMPDPEKATAEFNAFGEAADETEALAVQASLDAYRQALLAENGADAWETVDAHTRAYYQNMLDLCQSADSATVADLAVLELMTVLMMRARVPAEQMAGFDARALFVYAIDEGMIGKGGVMAMQAGTVRIDGDHAKAEALIDEQTTGLFMDFYQEENAWRFDLTSLFVVAGAAMAAQIDMQGQTPVEFTFEVLELLTGEAADPNIWHPVGTSGKP